MAQVELNKREIELLVQSLDHCLATCKHQSSSGPCADCDAAKKLRERLAQQAGT